MKTQKSKLEKLFAQRGLLLTPWCCLVVSLSVQIASGQGRLNLEFRPSANYNMTNSGQVNIQNGGGFEAVASYRFMPHFSAYAGWGWNSFSLGDAFTGSDSHLEETGYTYGLQFKYPLRNSKISIMLRGGGVYNHVEVESGSDLVADSGHGPGWQLEGGVAIPVGRKWSLVPGIRYRSWSRNLTINSSEINIDLKYISIGMGVNWQL